MIDKQHILDEIEAFNFQPYHNPEKPLVLFGSIAQLETAMTSQQDLITVAQQGLESRLETGVGQ